MAVSPIVSMVIAYVVHPTVGLSVVTYVVRFDDRFVGRSVDCSIGHPSVVSMDVTYVVNFDGRFICRFGGRHVRRLCRWSVRL